MRLIQELVIVALMVLLAIAFAVFIRANQGRLNDAAVEFRRACKDRGGEAVHNGRNWECIK